MYRPLKYIQKSLAPHSCTLTTHFKAFPFEAFTRTTDGGAVGFVTGTELWLFFASGTGGFGCLTSSFSETLFWRKAGRFCSVGGDFTAEGALGWGGVNLFCDFFGKGSFLTGAGFVTGVDFTTGVALTWCWAAIGCFFRASWSLGLLAASWAVNIFTCASLSFGITTLSLGDFDLAGLKGFGAGCFWASALWFHRLSTPLFGLEVRCVLVNYAH